MTRAGLAAGNATFVVEGWHERGCGVCVQHTYKRAGAVPAETYRRVGLEAPRAHTVAAAKPSSAAPRLFTRRSSPSWACIRSSGLQQRCMPATRPARVGARVVPRSLGDGDARGATAAGSRLWSETVETLGGADPRPAARGHRARVRRGTGAAARRATGQRSGRCTSACARWRRTSREPCSSSTPRRCSSPAAWTRKRSSAGSSAGSPRRGWGDAGAFTRSGGAIRQVLAAPAARPRTGSLDSVSGRHGVAGSAGNVSRPAS